MWYGIGLLLVSLVLGAEPAWAQVVNIQLKWTFPRTQESTIRNFVIRRRMGTDPPKTIGQVPSDKRTYTDTTAEINTGYCWVVHIETIGPSGLGPASKEICGGVRNTVTGLELKLVQPNRPSPPKQRSTRKPG